MEDWKALYEKALQIAVQAHRGQVDKGGNPYIEHPLAVAGQVSEPAAKVVALLHDVVEDTPVSLEELGKVFPEQVVRAVELLTKKKSPEFSIQSYLEAIRENELARCVKIADLEHNMDLGRIPHPVERDYLRVEQYQKSKEYLEGKKKEK